jgi:hypothetical protein
MKKVIFPILLTVSAHAEMGINSAGDSAIGNVPKVAMSADFEKYLQRKLSVSENVFHYWKLDGVDIGLGFVPKKEIEIAKEFNPEQVGQFKSAAAINWASVIIYGAGLYFLFDNMFYNYKFIDGADGKRYRAQAIEDYNSTKFYAGASLTIAGLVGSYYGIKKHRKALLSLDKSMQKAYGI